MSARDELVDEIAGHPIGSGYYSTSVGIDEAREIADAILAAGYSKPRTISTVEELDALADGSVVMSADSEVWRLDIHIVKWWDMLTDDHVFTGLAKNIDLPATVLYTPKES